MKPLKIVISIFLAAAFCSCFTGVESAPKITKSDVKKEKIATSPEHAFLADVAPEPPAQWQAGKKFFVSDPKISIIFTAMSTANANNLAGSDIEFVRMYPVTSVTGEEVTEIEFKAPDGGRLFYRENTPYEQAAERQACQVPFAIEESMVQAVRQQMVGKRYYAVTPLWYDSEGLQAVAGLRHVPVDVIDVQPGNAAYPLRVVFRAEGADHDNSMYMTLGSQRTSTRNFHTIFSFTDPKVKYPQITPEVWELIRHSKVRDGMTRTECRLALGAPQTVGQRPTTAGMVEYWQYADGHYLVFQDGFLTSKLQ